MGANRLLIADDEPGVGSFFKVVGEACGYEVEVARNAATFKEKFCDFRPTVIVLELVVSGVKIVELFRFLTENGCQAKVLICSGSGETAVWPFERLGAEQGLEMAGHILKPVRLANLTTILQGLLTEAPSISLDGGARSGRPAAR